MSLRETALQANQEQKEGYRTSRLAEREKTLDDLLERWEERWRHKLDEAPPVPPREDFQWVSMTYGEGRGRHTRVDGWLFVIDDIEFIHDRQQGMCVVLTCPDCGERHADSWYGLPNLGDKLKKQRTLFHECHKVAARNLASAIRSATNATGLPAYTIIEDALEIMSGWKA